MAERPTICGLIGIAEHLAVPPLPHHRALGYYGGSTGLGLGREIEAGETE
jgi:hypothetical protein